MTVDLICSEAGLGKRYFYESFADRDALLGPLDQISSLSVETAGHWAIWLVFMVEVAVMLRVVRDCRSVRQRDPPREWDIRTRPRSPQGWW